MTDEEMVEKDRRIAELELLCQHHYDVKARVVNEFLDTERQNNELRSRVEELEAENQKLRAAIAASSEANGKLNERLLEVQSLLDCCPTVGQMYAAVWMLDGQDPTPHQQEILDWLESRKEALSDTSAASGP
jgi:predicted phage gp36 major capsid-like protein